LTRIYIIFAIVGWSWTILVLTSLVIWRLRSRPFSLREKVRMRVPPNQEKP